MTLCVSHHSAPMSHLGAHHQRHRLGAHAVETWRFDKGTHKAVALQASVKEALHEGAQLGGAPGSLQTGGKCKMLQDFGEYRLELHYSGYGHVPNPNGLFLGGHTYRPGPSL
jgi:hypothetical protein